MSAPTDDELRTAVEVAVHAPSIRNTQPWRWVLRPGGLDLHSDPGRLLRVADPDGRGLHLSCGAALQHALLYLRAQGLECDVLLNPDAEDPTFLAAVRITDRITRELIDEADEELLYAVLWRTSETRGLSDSPVDPGDVDALREAARTEGGRLDVVPPGPLADRVAEVMASVERRHREDARYSDELSRWVRTDPLATDGIPAGQTRGGLQVGLMVAQGDAGAGHVPDVRPGDAQGPVMVVLSSESDAPVGWIRAGASLGRVLLTATARGLSATPQSPVLESRTAREQVRAILDVEHHPQALLRIGYLADEVPPLPLTPRRAISEIFVDPREAS